MSGVGKSVAALKAGGLPRRVMIADAATLALVIIIGAVAGSAIISILKLGVVLSAVLTSVLMVAVLFGPTHGLLVVAACLVANRVVGSTTGALDARAVEAAAIGVFALILPWGGRYISAASRRGEPSTTPPLIQARAVLEDFIRSRTSDLNWRATLRETRRGFVPFAFLACGFLGARLLRDLPGGGGGILSMMVAVFIAARAFGASYGFAAGVLGAVLLNDLLMPPAANSSAQTAAAVLTLAIFAAGGWAVGAMSDRLERKKSALEVLVSAGREIATTTDETVIHRVLFESLAKLASRSWVEIRNDEGEVLLVSDPASGPPKDLDTHDRPETWRSRPLVADGRTVGLVRWRFYGMQTDIRIEDEIAESLVDLGASAIVRARLSIEKSEMEFAARTEHLRTILLDAVSHHFRSPLAGILGSATSILSLPEEHDREVRRELLLIIKEQANRLSRYVDNFLSVARLESGAIDVKLVDVILEPLIYDVWETFGEAGGACRFLQVNLRGQSVRADPALLSQVLGNLLENAIKFSPEESIVDVSSWVKDGKLVLEVSDQGIGIQAGSEDNIFRRFFRNPGTKAPGLGLGLFITRSLVEIQGGEVTASNRTDGVPGLKVALTLPVAA